MADIGEKENLAETMPELTKELMTELDSFLGEANVSYPYRNAEVDSNPGHERVPRVVSRGAKDDRVWVEVETGDDKSPIMEAKLLYTVNGGKFEVSKGRREMWFAEPATIKDGHIEGKVPPGASHAAFCMRDSKGFLVMSERLPSYKIASSSSADSKILKHSWPFRPGLFALIGLAKEASAALDENDNVDSKLDAELSAALKKAELVYATEEPTDDQYYETIRELRDAIRNLKDDAPQSKNYYLNLFRQGGPF